MKIFFSGIQIFYICPHASVDIIRVFLISDFLAESLKASKNYRKNFLILQYTFAQNTSLILWTSSHLTLKIICPCNTAKDLYEFSKNFPANTFLFCVRKNICTPPFLDAQKCIFLSTLKANVRFFLYISIRKDVVRFYLMGHG